MLNEVVAEVGRYVLLQAVSYGPLVEKAAKVAFVGAETEGEFTKAQARVSAQVRLDVECDPFSARGNGVIFVSEPHCKLHHGFDP